MVKFKPFKAIRPNPDYAKDIASLPYDVVNRKEASDLVADNPYSYLHIDRSEVDLPDEENPYADAVYAKAAQNLQDFQAKGWLNKDISAMFYIYELQFMGRSQTGLVGVASVEDYLNNAIKKHEFTRYEKEKDRIRHMDSCDANTSPIFLTYRDQASINTLIENWKNKHQPIYDFESFYDTQHRVWIVDDVNVQAHLQAAFEEQVPAMYIADGHHRTESAAKVSMMRKEAGTLSETGANFLSVAFPVQQLHIFDYNRLVKTDLPTNFIERLSEDFEINSVAKDQRQPDEQGIIGLYFDNQWYHTKLKADKTADDLVGRLDASVVQTFIFNKLFNIENPRQDNRLDFVGGIKGMDVLEAAVDSGEASLAIALYPTTTDDLLAVADAGEIMPPKSTWFEPKLLSGLFVHDLETKKK
ncbi:DUF1015 domain-containing protein [Fundicoccus culcitae]|uniref:DUF1015 family protein n=1 Tax=Fundicoccus culcitae TaxID=2969821 RepID=A0ABY5P5T1_9LACT|nr:DUF1015 family protein [Fundicoccus culcitae]UUX33735.1 DUF1015 family protein [Fundicoccus culcitae]